MAQREGFGSGFLLGSLVGGIVGGVIGAVFVARNTEDEKVSSDDGDLFRAPAAIDASDAENLATDARRSLEEKISQIDRAIEDVRQRLGGEQSTPIE